MELFFSDRLRCAECHAGFTFSGPVDFIGSRPGAESLLNTGVGSGTDRFRIPSLRSIARSAPYMHNGVFSTLAEVIAFYDKGSPSLAPLDLSPAEKEDLITFLESLSGDKILIEHPTTPGQHRTTTGYP